MENLISVHVLVISGVVKFRVILIFCKWWVYYTTEKLNPSISHVTSSLFDFYKFVPVQAHVQIRISNLHLTSGCRGQSDRTSVSSAMTLHVSVDVGWPLRVVAAFAVQL
jgi:hypothetical protein